jgi:hypothetical protein
MAIKVRTENPPQYKNYRSYKPFLRREFDHSCVYCDVWESELGGRKSFHIDHYRPKERKQFKHLIANYSNLLYSCRDCNEFKTDYWPNFLDWFLGRIYLNPCQHDVALHIDKTDYIWAGLTNTGIFNIEELHLAEETRTVLREERDRLRDLLKESKLSLDTAERAIQVSVQTGDEVAERKAREATKRFEGLIAYCERILAKRRD